MGEEGGLGYGLGVTISRGKNPIRAEMASLRPCSSRGSGMSLDITERQALKDADSYCSGPFGPRFMRDEDERKGIFRWSMVMMFEMRIWFLGSMPTFLTFSMATEGCQ